MTVAELALGKFEGCKIKPNSGVIAGYNNSMGDLINEWTLNYTDSEDELPMVGTENLLRSGTVQKTDDGETGWAATLEGNGYLYNDNISLPQEGSFVIVFQINQSRNHVIFLLNDQMKVTIDEYNKIHLWFKDDSGNEHTYDGSTPVTLDNWHQIVVGVGKAKARVILDDEIEIEDMGGSWQGLYTPTTKGLKIGSDGTDYMYGKIDRVKLYNRVFGLQDANDEREWNQIRNDFIENWCYTTPWLPLTADWIRLSSLSFITSGKIKNLVEIYVDENRNHTAFERFDGSYTYRTAAVVKLSSINDYVDSETDKQFVYGNYLYPQFAHSVALKICGKSE